MQFNFYFLYLFCINLIKNKFITKKYFLLLIYATITLISSSLYQDILVKADLDENAEIDFSEFVQYMIQHERELRLVFQEIDKNKDGKFVMTIFLVLPWLPLVLLWLPLVLPWSPLV